MDIIRKYAGQLIDYSWFSSRWFVTDSVSDAINCYENCLLNKLEYKPKSKLNLGKMNFIKIIFALLCLINVSTAAGLKAKANMRSMVTNFSGLSPRQIQLIKRIIKIQKKIQYGRFA